MNKLETELFLGVSGSIVDSFTSLFFGIVNSLVSLVNSSILSILYSTSGSVGSTFNGVFGTFNSVGSLCGSVNTQSLQGITCTHQGVNTLCRKGSNASNERIDGSIVTDNSLNLVSILLQETLNLAKILLSEFGIGSDEAGNLGLDSFKSGLQSACVLLLNLLRESRDSLLGSSVYVLNYSFCRVNDFLSLLLSLVTATCERNSHNGQSHYKNFLHNFQF